MNDAEFERLDRLSNGRLRHLLVGSPSGYMWSDQVRAACYSIILSYTNTLLQVETILAHEAALNAKSKTPTDPKMLPTKERIKRLKSAGVDVENLVEAVERVPLTIADDIDEATSKQLEAKSSSNK